MTVTQEEIFALLGSKDVEIMLLQKQIALLNRHLAELEKKESPQ